ncbi:hypothetical protein HDU76_001782, partial [Blyttiomyces sp. JEL0837]
YWKVRNIQDAMKRFIKNPKVHPIIEKDSHETLPSKETTSSTPPPPVIPTTSTSLFPHRDSEEYRSDSLKQRDLSGSTSLLTATSNTKDPTSSRRSSYSKVTESRRGSAISIVSSSPPGIKRLKSTSQKPADLLIHFNGYSALIPIHGGIRNTIYRAVRSSDSQHVIIKCVQCDGPNDLVGGLLKSEYKLLKEIEVLCGNGPVSGIITAHDIVPFESTVTSGGGMGGLGMVMEDIGGFSLLSYIEKKTARFLERHAGVDPALLLSTGFHLAEILGIIKDVAASLQKLHDSSYLTAQSQEITTTAEGTLSFMSPEQTGRFNRSIDCRSDLYCLGGTFYYLLTGNRPFEDYETDELSIIHAHLARNIVPPCDRNIAIPVVVSDMVVKLMQKSPEDRYQTAKGLIADIDKYINESHTQAFVTFQLGEFDTASKFSLPDRLFGRDKELECMRQAFVQTCNLSIPHLFLVAGYSGIGKTRFVNEIIQYLTASRAVYITGKCDQIRNRPFSCFLQAFQSLLKRVLAGSEAEVQKYKTAFTDGIRNPKLLIQILPELKAVLSEKELRLSEEEELPLDTSHLFQEAVVDFVSVITSEQPLCIFVDDLQWGDHPTFQLLQALLLSQKVGTLFLIGSFRSNELSHKPLLRCCIEKLQADVPERMNLITLQNFDLSMTMEFVENCFKGKFDIDEITKLAVDCHEKTHGNPFHLGKLLQKLYEEKVIVCAIVYDEGTCNVHFKWSVDTKARTNFGSENILELVLDEMRNLDTNTNKLLQYASGIGNTFHLGLLRRVLPDWKISEIIMSLNTAIKSGIIYPATPWAGKLTPDMEDSFINELLETDNPRFRFSHDRMQEAAYESIPSEEVSSVEWTIGIVWLDATEVKSVENDNLFEGAEHLEKALQNETFRDLLTKDLIDVAGMALLYAGMRAFQGHAMQAVIKYLSCALKIIGEQGWRKGSVLNDLLFDAYYCGQRAAVAIGDSAFRVKMFQQIDGHVDDPLMKAKALLTEAEGLVNDGDELCQKRCFEAMNLLGVFLPKKVSPLRTVASVLE